MLNQPESLTGPLSTRGRRRHARTLLGAATAQHALNDYDRDPGARISLPTPIAAPRPLAGFSDDPIIESQPWAPDGETLDERIARTGTLTFVEASTLLDQLVAFSLHQPDDGLVHRPTTQRVRLLTETAGAELQLIGVDGEAPADEDYESVIFQLGVVLYVALTGQDPFPGRTPAHSQLLRVNGRYRPATHLNHELPQGIDDFFVRTFSVDHSRRFASAFEMRSAFLRIAEHILPPPRAEVVSDLDIPIEVDVEPESLPLPPPVIEEPPPLSYRTESYRMDDVVAAGLTVPGPKRTGRIFFGMALLTAASVAATTFIAREVEQPPTREQTEELARTLQTEAVEAGQTVLEVGESVKAKVDAAR